MSAESAEASMDLMRRIDRDPTAEEFAPLWRPEDGHEVFLFALVRAGRGDIDRAKWKPK